MAALNSSDLIDLITVEECDGSLEMEDEIIANAEIIKFQPLIPAPVIRSRPSLDYNNPFDKAHQLANSNYGTSKIVDKEIDISKPSNISYNDVKTENIISIHDDDNGDRADDENIPKESEGYFDLSRNTRNDHSVQKYVRFMSEEDLTKFISPIQLLPLSEIATTDANSKTGNNDFSVDNCGWITSDNRPINCQLNKDFLSEFSSSLEISSDNYFPNGIKVCDLKSSSSSSSTDLNLSNIEERQKLKRTYNKMTTESLGTNPSHVLNSMHKQLLKLNLSNAPLNSSAKQISDESNDKNVDNSIFSEARALAESILRSNENGFSPIGSCDDLMSIKPNWIDLDNDFDNDLQMLNMAIPQLIEKVEHKNGHDFNGTVINERLLEDIKNPKETYKVELKQPSIKVDDAGNVNTDQDVKKLIDNLKNSLEHYDEERKDHAKRLLETLSLVLNKREISSTKDGISVPTPSPIIRQGTFDLDIPDKTETTEYDNDIKTFGPDLSPELSDIIEQTKKLIGSHQNQSFNVYETNLGSSNNTVTNPTYVVVVQSSIPMENQKTIDSGTFREPTSIEMRTWRSQSVSLHDKPNISSKSPSCNVTPYSPRIPARRFSISGTPQSLPVVNTRRDLYGAHGKDVSKTNVVSQRQSIASTTKQITVAPKNPTKIKLDKVSKPVTLKKNDSIKNVPPMATIPTKKVIPMIVVTPSVSSQIADDQKVKPNTVTTFPKVREVPSACATPAKNRRVSFSSVSIATKKPKSVTPNAKLQSVGSRRKPRSVSSSPKISLNTQRNGKGNPEVATTMNSKNFRKV